MQDASSSILVLSKYPSDSLIFLSEAVVIPSQRPVDGPGDEEASKAVFEHGDIEDEAPQDRLVDVFSILSAFVIVVVVAAAVVAKKLSEEHVELLMACFLLRFFVLGSTLFLYLYWLDVYFPFPKIIKRYKLPDKITSSRNHFILHTTW